MAVHGIFSWSWAVQVSGNMRVYANMILICIEIARMLSAKLGKNTESGSTLTIWAKQNWLRHDTSTSHISVQAIYKYPQIKMATNTKSAKCEYLWISGHDLRAHPSRASGSYPPQQPADGRLNPPTSRGVVEWHVRTIYFSFDNHCSIIEARHARI